MAIDVVDWEIKSSEMQQVEAELDPGEVAFGEAGSLVYMDAGIVMDTEFGDSRKNAGGGFLGKLLSADKRLVTGESPFTTRSRDPVAQKQLVALAALCPGASWLQGPPCSRLASGAFAAAPQRGGSREAGALLGGIDAGGLLGGILGGGDSEDE